MKTFILAVAVLAASVPLCVLAEKIPVTIRNSTDFRKACHLDQRRSGLMGCVCRLPVIDFIAGGATGLPLRLWRSQDEKPFFRETV